MLTYTETLLAKKNKECLEKFDLIKQTIDLADFSEVQKLNCHTLSLAIADAFSLSVNHGYYLPGYEHSWCVDTLGNIIDVYPWGCIGGPILIAKEVVYSLEFNGLYKVNNSILDPKDQCLQSSVCAIKTELTNLLSNLKAA